MPVDLNRDDHSDSIKQQIEDKIVDLQVEVRLLPEGLNSGYDIRLGDGHTWATTIVAPHNPHMAGWNERLTRIVHGLIQRYASERYLKK